MALGEDTEFVESRRGDPVGLVDEDHEPGGLGQENVEQALHGLEVGAPGGDADGTSEEARHVGEAGSGGGEVDDLEEVTVETFGEIAE
jgi:hypothetical protein